VPIASAAKVITALVILDKHPLAAGESGPRITMTASDVAIYNAYVAKNGSVTPVSVGQKLTERQMIQAVMLPSANNIADSLVIWSFGSIKNYLEHANKFLDQKGLADTTVGVDASGYSPASTSTARDLVKLGALAMQNPALAEISAQKTAVIPGVGTVRNYNSLLGANGIVGIKTGNHDQNKGVFIGAATRTVNGKDVTLISALSGASSLSAVLRDSRSLLVAVQNTFADTTVVQKDAVLGTYRQANGQVLQAVATREVSTTVLRGMVVKADVKLKDISYNTRAGQVIGTIIIPANDFTAEQRADVVLRQAPTKPDIWYRLTHP
jgi:D-alanyl-D-alanine carboxypeptidase (penicillin-binding protein 5/6)